MSEWDDLFAKAGGLDASTDDTDDALPTAVASGGKRSLGQRHREARRAYLAGRWRVAPSWPPHLELRGALAAPPLDCAGYAAASSLQGVVAGESGDDCRRCGRPAWRHWTAVANPADRIEPLVPLLCVLRNARCAALQAAIATASDQRLEGDYSQYLKRVLRDWKEQTSSEARHTQSDLRDKHQRVAQHIDDLIKYVSSPSGMKNKIHESGVRLVMACDAVYYHLYYQQLTTDTNFSYTDMDDSFVVPHPVSYFGLMASPTACQKQRMAAAHLKPINVTLSSIRERWGLNDTSDDDQHPLQVVHHHRLLETLCCFQNVPRSSTSLTAIQRRLGAHEAPATDLLMDWRDSCRDFMCHLYAYATLPPRAIRRIIDLARPPTARHDGPGSSILELGAGTGYLAELLKRRGVDVLAFDAAPTTLELDGKLNEYHGQTPSFTSIQQGDERVLLQLQEVGRSILMLCYPPPESEFARKAIRNFMERGGRTIVFIGEFKGLTGSPSMEKQLQQAFKCVERIPCYSWGPDASYVSVWTRGQVSDDTADGLLIPCCQCRVNESRRRFRFLRFLTYCSYACFKKGAKTLETHSELASVPMSAAALDFDDANFFSAL